MCGVYQQCIAQPHLRRHRLPQRHRRHIVPVGTLDVNRQLGSVTCSTAEATGPSGWSLSRPAPPSGRPWRVWLGRRSPSRLSWPEPGAGMVSPPPRYSARSMPPFSEPRSAPAELMHAARSWTTSPIHCRLSASATRSPRPTTRSAGTTPPPSSCWTAVRSVWSPATNSTQLATSQARPSSLPRPAQQTRRGRGSPDAAQLFDTDTHPTRRGST